MSAALGALGAALATMVANLSSHKRGWDDRWEEFSDAAVEGKDFYTKLVGLVDEDTDAFNQVLAALKLPQGSDEERQARAEAVEQATKAATEVPLCVMEVAAGAMDVIRRMAETGLASSASDAGVGAICARAAVMGAHLNVRINTASLDDKAYVKEVLAKAERIARDAAKGEQEVLEIVLGRM